MIVTITDIQNAIYKAQNMVYAIALNITDCYEQGGQPSDEKYELATQLQSYIDVLGRVDLDENDCIDSDEIWEIISWINGNQVLAEMCLVIPAQYSNPGQPIPVPDGGCCGVETVTGPQVDNTDPKHPVVAVYVNPATISGAGTFASPFSAIGGGGGSGTVSSGAQYRLAYYAAAGTTVSNANAITGSRALKSDANGVPTHFDTATEPSLTELTYVKGLTSAVQTQLNAKQDILTAVNLGDLIVSLTNKTTPVDADSIVISDSAASDDAKKVSLTNFKIFLKTYFDTIYQAILTASNMHTFVDALQAMTSPADADRMLIVDNSASLAKKITWTNIKASLKTYFDTIYSNIAKITTGDQTTTSNVATNITGISFSVAANKRYYIRGVMHIGCNNTGGVKIALTTPSAATFFVSLTGRGSTNTTSVAIGAIVTSGTLSGATFLMGNSTGGHIIVEGEITTGANAGTAQFQFASGVNTQTSTIYQEGTILELKEI